MSLSEQDHPARADQLLQGIEHGLSIAVALAEAAIDEDAAVKELTLLRIVWILDRCLEKNAETARFVERHWSPSPPMAASTV